MEGQLSELLDRLVADFQERSLPRLTPRSLRLPGLPGKADVVVGMRRCGKTCLLFQEIQERLASGVGLERVLYVNFEDERLLPLAARDLGEITEAFYRRFPASRQEPCWFYFDEIQNVPGWERFVRRLLDSERAAITLTGSSAKLLSREIATSLRGRSLSSELFPFSFEEALRHGGVEIPSRWPPPARQRSLLEHGFQRYLEQGGFPEVQAVSTDLRLRILQEYVNVALFRDVAERYGVENLPALRYLERSLLGRPSGKFSLHRLYNDLKSQGLRISKDSIYTYLGYLEDAFLLFTVSLESPSLRARQVNPRKCYAVDHALAAAVSFRASSDLGHLLENAVAVELRRRGGSLTYVRTAAGHEVDFLVRGPGGQRDLVQVSAEMRSPETRRREIRALEEAMAELRVDRATVVTMNEEESLEVGAGVVRVVPAWRWLLEPPPAGQHGGL